MKRLPILMWAGAVVSLTLTAPAVSAGSIVTDSGYEAAALSTAYTISGTQITVQVTAGADITETLDDALEEARDMATDSAPVTVVVPKGSYKLTGNLHIYSNTTLDLSGSTLTYAGTESHNMLMLGTNGSYQGEANYNTSAKCSGYGGFKNVTVKNGTFQSIASNDGTIIRMAHATNVTLENLTLSGGGCEHQIAVVAIDGFYVRNCTFKDYGKDGSDASNKNKEEALQLDIPCSSKLFKNTYLDGTVMKNVEITGCTFSNVPRGVGTHAMLYGAYHENIKINNNTFINVLEEAVVALDYYNCEIKNNTITNCGAGILCQFFKSEDESSAIYKTIFDGATKYNGSIKHDAKTEISGNTISTKYSATCSEVQGIRVVGRLLTSAVKGGDGKSIPVGDYYITGVTVKNNNITTAGHGIHLTDAKSCQVTNNTIKGANVSAKDERKDKYDGIIVQTSSDNTVITDNTISNMVRNGIFVQNETVVSEVSNNKISGCGEKGINFFDSSGCTGQVSGNVISGCSAGGIIVSTKSTTGSIVNNKITALSDKKTVSNGINIYNSSKVKGDISGNTISNAYGMGISISTKATVTGSISKNTIKKSAKSGIFVFKSSSVGKDIDSNKVTNSKANGIYITGTTTVKGNISNNTINTAGGKGIFVYDTKSKTTVTAVINNTVKKAKSQGINITSTKNNLLISGNKLSGGSDNVIIIQPGNKKYKITVTGNTIKGNNKAAGIRVISGKVSVSDNTISNVANGIYTNSGVSGSIYTNTYGKKVTTQLYIAGTKTKNTVSKMAVKSVTSPAKKQIKVKWAKVKSVAGYEIQYSTSKDFSKSVKSVTVSSKSTSKIIKGLKSGKTYYVRISSYKTVNGLNVFTGFGKAKKIKVK